MLIHRDFSFDAAHKLEEYHGKCEALHGHTYRMRVTLQGTPDHEGMIIDFVKVKEIVQGEVLSLLDHAYLNDIIPQPTAENIAAWSWKRLDSKLGGELHCLHSIRIWETANSSVTIFRKDMEPEVD